MNTIEINNQNVLVKQYNGQRVVTFKDIDTVHGRADGTARRNFNSNKKHFIEDEDFFKISPNEFRTAIAPMDKRQTNDITLITETGYLMLVKSFTDELSWSVQRQLVNNYFRTNETKDEIKPALSDYTYTEKKYKGEAVMSIADVAHFTNLSSYKIRKALLYCHELVDYYRLKKDELCKFKSDNNIINTSSEMLIVNKGGFKVICNTYGIKIEMPKTFADEINRTLPVKPAEEFVLVLENQKVQKYIKQISDYSDVLKVLLQLANKHNIKVEDWKSKTHDIFDIAIALSGVASQLESARVQTTDKYKW